MLFKHQRFTCLGIQSTQRPAAPVKGSYVEVVGVCGLHGHPHPILQAWGSPGGGQGLPPPSRPCSGPPRRGFWGELTGGASVQQGWGQACGISPHHAQVGTARGSRACPSPLGGRTHGALPVLPPRPGAGGPPQSSWSPHACADSRPASTLSDAAGLCPPSPSPRLRASRRPRAARTCPGLCR